MIRGEPVANKVRSNLGSSRMGALEKGSRMGALEKGRKLESPGNSTCTSTCTLRGCGFTLRHRVL